MVDLRHNGNRNDATKLFIAAHNESKKMNEFSWIILVGMSEYCNAVFQFNIQIYFIISFVFT